MNRRQPLLNFLHIFTDALLLFAALTLSYFLRFIGPHTADFVGFPVYARYAVFLIPVTLLLYSSFNLYGSFRTTRFRSELRSILLANAVMLLLFLALLYMYHSIDASRFVLLLFSLIASLFISVKHLLMRRIVARLQTNPRYRKSLVIVGSGAVAAAYRRELQRNDSLGYTVLGYVSDTADFEDLPHMGGYSELAFLLNERMPDMVVCALDISDAEQLQNVVDACEESGTRVAVIPFCYRFLSHSPAIEQVGRFPLIHIREVPLDNLGRAFVKRTVDIFGSLFAIILTSPLMLGAAIAVRLSSKGPVIFRQTRVGYEKKPFTMYKFRSMECNDSETTGWSTETDSRRTKVGSFIRKFSIDELPQLFNVLIGNMSLVGPRPEVPHYVNDFRATVPLYMVKHQVKPGITGLAQVRGCRGDTSIEERVENDIYYIEHWSLLLDFEILFLTVFGGKFVNRERLGNVAPAPAPEESPAPVPEEDGAKNS